MRAPAWVILTLLALTATLAANVAGPANPTYNITVNPTVPLSCGGTATLTLSLTNGQSNQAYLVLLEVQKPDGIGTSTTSRIVNTDNRGNGTMSVRYPDPSFTPANGTVATDVAGVYNVVANQTGPTDLGTVATAGFTVSCQLTVVVSQPVPGTSVERGRKVAITATVSDLSGPISTATVTANTPSNGQLLLSQTSPGVYSIDYQVELDDPLGTWTLLLEATDTRGNLGTSNPTTISVFRSNLIVDALAAYNSQGLPETDFSPGDTIYPFFRIRYSSGEVLTTGQYRVSFRNPSGATVANLTTVYDTSRFGFYSPTGFTISSADAGGSWSMAIDSSSLDDGFGNTGPTISTSVRVQIITSPLGYLPFLVGALMALVGGVIVLKRFHTSLQGFEHLEQLMGGNIPRASSLLLIGDPGSGKSILCYQLLWDELESGRQCAILSYDAFPEDIRERMREFGWNITPHLRKGGLKILDCYSGLTGEGQGAIRDPSDLTELNIQVTSFIGKAKNEPVTLILDSLTPIFNGVATKQAISFVQTIGAKVKKTGGHFIVTATYGAIPTDSIAKIKSIVDGIIELSFVKVGHHSSRYLSVVKMERRTISPEDVPIEIDRKRGLVFRTSRFRTVRDRLAGTNRGRPEPATGSLTDQDEEVLSEDQSPASEAHEAAKSSITPETPTEQHGQHGLHRTGTQRRDGPDS